MKISTYKSLLTNKKTHVIVSIGKCGHKGYREAQIRMVDGNLAFIITDGYNYLTIERTGFKVSLKSVINHAHAAMVTSLKA